MSVPGIIVDLSSNNTHPIDYAAAKAAGVVAAFIKATEGTTYVNPDYTTDVAGFQAVGVPVLAYHFADFTDAAAEAAHFKSVAGSLARVLDSETSTNAAWQNDFLTALNVPGDEELDYGSASSLPQTGVRSLLWPASYGRTPGFGDCWQYTSSQTVAGIPGPVDASEWTGSQADFDALFSIVVPAPAAPGKVIKPTSGRYGMLNAPIVAVCPTPTGKGYTLVGADGGTFNFGDAVMLGSLAGKPLNAPVVDAQLTSTGKGLVMVATDGGVFAFGDAPFDGSEGGKTLNAPVVGICLTTTDKGYWLTAADGGVFSFGDAQFYGSEG